MALLTTVTSSNPASWIFLRSTDAPMADEPMPASQAKTIALIGPRAWRPSPVSAAATDDFLPFSASISAVAAARSTSSSDAVEPEQERRRPGRTTAARAETDRG